MLIVIFFDLLPDRQLLDHLAFLRVQNRRFLRCFLEPSKHFSQPNHGGNNSLPPDTPSHLQSTICGHNSKGVTASPLVIAKCGHNSNGIDAISRAIYTTLKLIKGEMPFYSQIAILNIWTVFQRNKCR